MVERKDPPLKTIVTRPYLRFLESSCDLPVRTRRFDAFDRYDMRSPHDEHRRETREDKLTVKQYGASATFAGVAAGSCSPEIELVAQDIDQAAGGIDVDLNDFAVESELDTHLFLRIAVQKAALKWNGVKIVTRCLTDRGKESRNEGANS